MKKKLNRIAKQIYSDEVYCQYIRKDYRYANRGWFGWYLCKNGEFYNFLGVNSVDALKYLQKISEATSKKALKI